MKRLFAANHLFSLSWAMLIIFLIGTISLTTPQRIDAAPIKELFIWPDQFIAVNSNQYASQSPSYIQPYLPPGFLPHGSEGPFPNVNFFFPLDNVIGKMKEIVGLTMYYTGLSPDGFCVVRLSRVKMGSPGILLIEAFRDGATQGIIEVKGNNASGGPFLIDKVMLKEYRFYISVHVDNNQGMFNGMVLQYR